MKINTMTKPMLFLITLTHVVAMPQWFYEPQLHCDESRRMDSGNIRGTSVANGNLITLIAELDFTGTSYTEPDTRVLSEDSITDEQITEIEAILSVYEDLIDRTHYDIQLGFGTNTDENYNDFYRTCTTPEEYGNSIDFSFTPDAQFKGVETNREQIVFRYSPEGTYDRTEIEDLNTHQSLFADNLDDQPNLSWQYYGGVDGTTASYPALNMTEIGACDVDGSALPNDERYDPTARPWFTSGATGQGDGIIVFDISDTSPGSATRLEMQVDVALGIIDSRSYRDFWTVIVYSSYPRKFRSTLTRMDSVGKAELTDYINEISIDYNGKTNIGLAIEEALGVFTESDTSGDTSLCHKSIILLTNGENDINVINPVDLLKKSTLGIRVFSYIMSPEDDNPSRIFPTEMACYTDGLVEVYTDYPFNLTSTVLQDKPVALYNSFMADGVNTEIGRWSEPYLDSLGQGRMVTITRAVYKTETSGSGDDTYEMTVLMGIIGFDVLMDEITLGGAVSETDLLVLMTENQVCEDFYMDSDTRTTLQGDDTCDNLYADESVDKPGWMVFMWALVLVSVIISCVCIVGSFGIYGLSGDTVQRKQASVKRCNIRFTKHGSSEVFLVVTFFSLLAILILLWTGIWADIVEAHEWRPTLLTVEDGQTNPFDCCDVINCGCIESYGLDSCSTMVSNIDAGYCNNGYHCCNKIYYSCNCYSRTTCSKGRCTTRQSCSTCSRCTSSVNNRQCESACGTCYYPSVYVNYEIDVNNDGEYSLQYSAITGKCGRDQENCATGFINDYPAIGETFWGYYSIYNTAELKLTVGYNYVTIVFFAIFIIMNIYNWYLAVKITCQDDRLSIRQQADDGGTRKIIPVKQNIFGAEPVPFDSVEMGRTTGVSKNREGSNTVRDSRTSCSTVGSRIQGPVPFDASADTPKPPDYIATTINMKR